MAPQLDEDTLRIAIVGGSGFIGSAVTAEARRVGVPITTITAPRLQVRGRIDLGAVPPALNNAVVDRLADELRGHSVVVNAAGISDAGRGAEADLVAANALLPLLLAHACVRAGVRRLVHISSAAVQGRTPLDETSRVAPFSPYSRSKALGERWLARAADLNLDVSIVRPTSVHGHGRNVTEKVRRLASSPLGSYAGAPRTTPQTLVSTVARSVLRLATYRGEVPPIVLTPDEGVTTRSFLRLVGGREPKRVPDALARHMVRATEHLGCLHPRLAAYARRLELLWYGQERCTGWLDYDISLLASPEEWSDIRTSDSDRVVLFGVTTGHSVRPFFAGMHGFLYQRGWKVVLTCADEGDPRVFASQEGAEYRPIAAAREPRPTQDARTLLQLVRLLRDTRPAVAVWGTPKLGLLGPLASRLTGTPSVYVVHGLRLETVRQPLLRAALRLSEAVAMHAATSVVAVGNELRREIITSRLAPADRVIVLRHGSANGVPAACSADAGLPREGRQAARFGFVGRVTHDKGIAELLDAWSVVRKEHPTATLTVAGALEMPTHHPLVRELMTSPGVEYLGHVASPRALYDSLTALVLPSHREGLPTVVLEAAAHAVPSIVTSSTGTSEPVIPEKTGIVVPVSDAAALAAAMVRLARSTDAAIEMGLRARDHVRTYYAQEPLWRAWDTHLLGVSTHRRAR